MESTNYIHIAGARVHNLKNIDVIIPRNSLVVVTGVSGSGKSSLVMDTLFAEGQRKYVESLSSYARQFLTRMEKPDVDYITGLSPAISISQHVSTSTTRSTVGTMTEIYDYLRLLFAKIGKYYDPTTNEPISRFSTSEVLDILATYPENTKIRILAPLHEYDKDALSTLGIRRILLDNTTYNIEDEIPNSWQSLYALVDRAVIKHDTDNIHRLSDSIELAFLIGNDMCGIDFPDGGIHYYNKQLEWNGKKFEPFTIQDFNFNSPQGACPHCEGFGNVVGISRDLVLPNPALSVYDDAVAPWRTEKMSVWKKNFVRKALAFDFPIHTPISQLTKEQYKLLWKGANGISGIDDFFKEVQENNYKIQYRVLESKYRGKTLCPKCEGTRLKIETNYVRIQNTTIGSCITMSIKDLYLWVNNLILDSKETIITKRLLPELINRLKTMKDIGLDYLAMNRLANTLSGGETQRIHLTRTLGSNLSDSLYILDEPSIGLHSYDTMRLIDTLVRLRDLGNTVVVVEHDEDIIRHADFLIDIGPEAGINGGHVVFCGKYTPKSSAEKSLTLDYLQGKRKIDIPSKLQNYNNYIELRGANRHNLKTIDIKIPLHALTVVTGVSGSGKTTLIKDTLVPAIRQKLEESGYNQGVISSLSFPQKLLQRIEFIDQNPIGRSSRSNPITYVKAYDIIRDIFAQQNLSKIRGYSPGYFSFNIEGGRCETCQGEGETVVEMQFLADVHLTCEDCGGKRFKQDILEVKYKEKNIADILSMTVDDAIVFFYEKKDLLKKLIPLQQVGLGYVQLGQSSSTLSGGEAQRIKLASFLQKGNLALPTLFIFDEPTTGLHFHDIQKLLIAFRLLIESGNTVVVIEHQMDVIKNADWIIDLGPGGGDAGGHVMYQGIMKDFLVHEDSITAKYLKEKLSSDATIS